VILCPGGCTVTGTASYIAGHDDDFFDAMPSQPSLAAPNQLASKRRTSLACVSCRARKVRCDYLQTGNPCTTCRVDGFDCEVASRKKRRRRVNTTRSSRTLSGSVETETNHLARPQHTQSCSSEDITNLQPSDRLEDGYPTLPDTPRSQTELSQHRILHQVPHYAFLVGLTQSAASEGLGPTIRRPKDDVFLRLQACQSADAAVSPNSQYGQEELFFLQSTGCLNLPDQATMGGFIMAYFQFFHPFFPIVSKPAFLDEFRAMDIYSGKGPSLLLLRAILFIASGVSRSFQS
jgi:hypothetical protein